MLILRRAAFFHVPKCAGTFVEEACRCHAEVDDAAEARLPGSRGRGHALPREVPSDLLEGRLRFAVLRDPVDWYRSCFHYMTRRAEAGNDNVYFEDYGYWWGRTCGTVLHESRLAAGGRLNRFVAAIQERWPAFLSDVYVAFAADVDVVLPVEDVREGLIATLQRAGERFDAEGIRAHSRVNESGSGSRSVPAATARRIRRCEELAVAMHAAALTGT
jgi:hypothetical protein